ncbi:GNAT family N-acetyltransferase [Bizionia paragorgiae]|uniref:GNAT family N-acetyltransferase n=1 Tax=Bizionia paragorgiae TaxID=283786 RepID=UPI003A910FE3
MVELRNYHLEYIPDFVKYRNNPKIYKQGFDKTPDPYTYEHAKELFIIQIEKKIKERFLIFSEDEFCGEIGIWLKDDVNRCNAEIGYFIAEPFWGKGIATQAIALMTEYAFNAFDLVRIVASVFEYNIGSMRALEKNDFILECVQKKGVVKNNKLLDNYIWVKFREY